MGKSQRPLPDNIQHFFLFLWCCDPTRAMASSFLRFLDHTQRRITVGRAPLDEWSARRRDLYLTTHNSYTNVHARGGIRTHDLNRWAAVDLRLRTRGHRARLYNTYKGQMYMPPAVPESESRTIHTLGRVDTEFGFWMLYNINYLFTLN